MSVHRAVVEAGPGVIRRLCCGDGTSVVVEAEMAAAALDSIDDPVALVAALPVPVDSLWRDVLRSLECGRRDSVVIVHPSWWAPERVGVVTGAARVLADDVVPRQRSWVLAQASPIGSSRAAVVVEIADQFVVVTGTGVVAERRRGQPSRVAEAVARAVVGMTPGAGAAVLIDEPTAVRGAAALATMIADALRVCAAGLAVRRVDDARLRRLAAAVLSIEDRVDSEPAAGSGPARPRRAKLTLLLLAVVVLAGVGIVDRHDAPAAAPTPTTFLVEGRIALEVPAQWPVRRIAAGPGSARVAVTSPSDPQVALHVTQSPVAGETLDGTAESLQRAIDAEPPGVFVDFNPSGLSAGRPAVTYREVRVGHDIRWTVLLDGSVRISIGCQSRPGGEETVRSVCEQAVRSARALH